MAQRPSKSFSRRALLVEKYAGLLPARQRKYALQRYFEDLSLAEIASRNKVSRFAVQDGLKRAMAVMERADKALRLIDRQRKIDALLAEIADEDLRERLRRLV